MLFTPELLRGDRGTEGTQPDHCLPVTQLPIPATPGPCHQPVHVRHISMMSPRRPHASFMFPWSPRCPRVSMIPLFPHIPAVRRCQALGLGGFESGCHQDPSAQCLSPERRLLPIARGGGWLHAGCSPCQGGSAKPRGIWGAGRSPGRMNAALASCSLISSYGGRRRQPRSASHCSSMCLHGHTQV